MSATGNLPITSRARTSPDRPNDPATKQKKHDTCCRCPACRGLECAERPRFFAGQLLTESELNSEQAYVIAKNRLHNRYLHGWGVVCGLEVVCSCEGFVHVRSGYAIDPCGNDIIVCKDVDFDLLGAINKCLDAKKRRADDCPPWEDPHANCDDEQHWCVTIEYKETEARPITPLRQESSSCGCGCGCGGAKKSSSSPSAGGCGCGGGCGDRPAPKPSRSAGPACEPTRILEQFRLDVIPQPAACAEAHRPPRTVRSVATQRTGIVAELVGPIDLSRLPTSVKDNFFFRTLLDADADGTLFAAILDTVDEVSTFITDQLTSLDQQIIVAAWKDYLKSKGSGSGATPAGGTSSPSFSADQLYTACCHFRRALAELYNANPLNVRCDGFDCPPCSRDDMQTPNATVGNAQPLNPFFCLIEAAITYIIDAICLKLLPPCPKPPCDDRVILACVTIRKGKIVHICNLACRHFAGSFNSLSYWASLVPVGSALASLVRLLCCSPEVLNAIGGSMGTGNLSHG